MYGFIINLWWRELAWRYQNWGKAYFIVATFSLKKIGVTMICISKNLLHILRPDQAQRKTLLSRGQNWLPNLWQAYPARRQSRYMMIIAVWSRPRVRMVLSIICGGKNLPEEDRTEARQELAPGETLFFCSGKNLPGQTRTGLSLRVVWIRQ